MLVLECVPSALAEEITAAVNILVIGIGAGANTDGQVLVMHDMLGLAITGRVPRFVKNLMDGESSIQNAFGRFVQEVKTGTFPSIAHQFN